MFQEDIVTHLNSQESMQSKFFSLWSILLGQVGCWAFLSFNTSASRFQCCMHFKLQPGPLATLAHWCAKEASKVKDASDKGMNLPVGLQASRLHKHISQSAERKLRIPMTYQNSCVHLEQNEEIKYMLTRLSELLCCPTASRTQKVRRLALSVSLFCGRDGLCCQATAKMRLSEELNSNAMQP